MPSLDDINAERDAAMAILDLKAQAANDLKNTGAPGMSETIDALVEQRAAVALQAYEGALDAPALAQALAVLRAATADMNAVAARMISATTFISNLASLGTAANKVVSALKGGG